METRFACPRFYSVGLPGDIDLSVEGRHLWLGWSRIARAIIAISAAAGSTGGRGLERRPAGTPDGITMVEPFTSDQILSVISAFLVE
ncbi:MAG TPA: hypothetical protein VIJ94_02040 [Caulobacteraceae bacterium]